MNVAEVVAGLRKVAGRLGLPFGPRSMTYNSRLAQELGKWAETKGRGEEFHLSAFRAYFVHGLNIAQVSVLTDLAASVGLDEEETRAVLDQRTFQEAVDRDWSYVRRQGVVAVPTFTAAERVVVGAQEYEVLAGLAEAAGAEKRGG